MRPSIMLSDAQSAWKIFNLHHETVILIHHINLAKSNAQNTQFNFWVLQEVLYLHSSARCKVIKGINKGDQLKYSLVITWERGLDLPWAKIAAANHAARWPSKGSQHNTAHQTQFNKTSYQKKPKDLGPFPCQSAH